MMALSVEPDEYLLVRNQNIGNSTLSFTGHKLLGGFQITENKLMVKKLEIPKLITSPFINKLRGTDLNEGFGIATTISDYQAYHKLKEEFFLKWLVDEKYHKGVVEKKFKNPNFICLGGRITDSLMTPAISRFGSWKVYAAKFNDTIYLVDVKEVKDTNQTWDLMSYYGIYFEHLLTQRNPDPSNINEFDKVFAINEVSFGSHQLLIMSELDAKRKDSEWAEIKVHKTCHPNALKGKYLKYWAQSIVPGIKTLVIGEHENGILQKIELTTTNALARKYDVQENDCYDFEDRLLTFISSHLQVNDPKVVKTFSWKDGDDRVNVEEISKRDIPKGMLPSWYIKAVQSGTAQSKALLTEVPTSKRKVSKTLPTDDSSSKRTRSKALPTDDSASKRAKSKALITDGAASESKRSKTLSTDFSSSKRTRSKALPDSTAIRSTKSKTLPTEGPFSKSTRSKMLPIDDSTSKSAKSKTLTDDDSSSKITRSKALPTIGSASKSTKSKTFSTEAPSSKRTRSKMLRIDGSASKSAKSKTLPDDGSASKSTRSKKMVTDGLALKRTRSKTELIDGSSRKLRKQK